MTCLRKFPAVMHQVIFYMSSGKRAKIAAKIATHGKHTKIATREEDSEEKEETVDPGKERRFVSFVYLLSAS